MSDTKTMALLVQDTENVMFDGQIDRITSYNEMGKFDIYPMHANFISIITKNVEIYQNRKMVKEIEIKQAVMKVKKDRIDIYLGLEMFYLDDIAAAESPIAPKKKRWIF